MSNNPFEVEKTISTKSLRTSNKTKPRRSRFSDYESSTLRAKRKYVNYDGVPLTDNQIAVRELMALRKEKTTR